MYRFSKQKREEEGRVKIVNYDKEKVVEEEKKTGGAMTLSQMAFSIFSFSITTVTIRSIGHIVCQLC
jgi:hypothetical protein